MTELRRRNVFRVAAGYALVAWIFIEAGSVLLPTFGAPEWFFGTVYVPIALGGFIIAMIVAWVFEITPDGVKLERDVDRETYTPRRKKSSNQLLIGLLVVALAISLTFNFTGMRDRDADAPASDELNSIAVLPFENRSTNEEDRYFADGINDDILTKLAEIESLRVISRTSVNEYRGTTKNIREIGEELGAATILEGALQRDGDKVRITVQLIDAQRDEHIWAKTYDRDNTLQSMFSIQSEIATEIAGTLQATMTDEDATRLAQVPTRDTNAYVAYVRGNQNLDKRGFESLIQARLDFEEAIALDPAFAKAHARLAETLLVTLSNHTSLNQLETYETADKHITEALHLDPQLADAHAARGLLEMSKWKPTRVGNGNALAAAAYEEAIRLNPNLANTYIWYATLKADEDHDDAAIGLLTKALTIDPLRRIPYVNLPNFLSAQGQNDEAIDWLLEAAKLFPDWETPYQYMSNQMMSLGRLDEAIAWELQTIERSADPMRGGSLLSAYQIFGDEEAITDFIASFPEDHPVYPLGKAYWHYINRDYQGAYAEAKNIPNDGSIPPQFYAMLAVTSAILVGDNESALEFLMSANPSISGDTQIEVSRFNVHVVILLAYLHQQMGNPAEAAALLTRASSVIESMPRLGMAGHGIRDVYIMILQGNKYGALEALDAAVDEGFTNSQTHNAWPFEDDPILDEIRDDPQFAEIENKRNLRIEAMRESYERAKETGDWKPLLARAGST